MLEMNCAAGDPTTSDWRTAHAALSRLARQRAAADAEEGRWLLAAQRQLEELVAGKHPGDAPSAPPDPAALRHVLRFEVTAETFALVREALAELRRRSDAALNDDALLEMARHVLVGPRDEGRSSYQIALSLCPGCSSAHLAANGSSSPSVQRWWRRQRATPSTSRRSTQTRHRR